FLYYLTLTLDANFWLKDWNCSSDVADLGLHTGLAYFVPNDPYKDHILKFATQNDISTCSGFKSLAHAETKFSTGLRVTGVGLCLCAQHEFVHPIGWHVQHLTHSISCLELGALMARELNEIVQKRWDPGQDMIASTITLAITTGESIWALVFNLSVDTAHWEEWMKMIEDWDVVKSKPNPYIAMKTSLSEAEVCAQLTDAERVTSSRGQLSHHTTSPSAFITQALTLEETQQRLASDIRNKTALTANQHTNVQQWRAALHHQICNFHSIQAVYMVDIEDIVDRNPDDLDAKPKEIALWLPSALQPATHTAICMNNIGIIEEKLRETQSRDTLTQLWNHLHTKSHSHAALLSLRGPGSWECELQTLQTKHICGPNATTSGDIDNANDTINSSGCRIPKRHLEALQHRLSEGHRTTSWIWKTAGVLGENEGLNKAGIATYANCQAAIQCDLLKHFTALWEAPMQAGNSTDQDKVDESDIADRLGLMDNPESSVYNGEGENGEGEGEGKGKEDNWNDWEGDE
ncbi:hypothetical protein PAXRUDRAFT_29068, partial [Paxillus rubicundulus Ve08.2h10]